MTTSNDFVGRWRESVRSENSTPITRGTEAEMRGQSEYDNDNNDYCAVRHCVSCTIASNSWRFVHAVARLLSVFYVEPICGHRRVSSLVYRDSVNDNKTTIYMVQ